jgi:hypothetical protein
MTDDCKIIEVVENMLNPRLLAHPFQRISNSIKDFWGRAQAEWEHMINVAVPLPQDAQEQNIHQVDRYDPEHRFGIGLSNESPWAQLPGLPCHAFN